MGTGKCHWSKFSCTSKQRSPDFGPGSLLCGLPSPGAGMTPEAHFL